MRIVEKLLDVERCSIFVKDPVNNKIWLKCGTGVVERQIEVDAKNSVVGKVIASGELAIEDNLRAKEGAHKSVEKNTGFVTRNMLCVPVKSVFRAEMVGAIQAVNKKSGDTFCAEDIETMEEIAFHLQTAIERAYLI
ncbi:MAG: GAF domain-containing protein [Rhodocyclaceae bacterium]|nr:GAF domain-containing protein [Rhodocyclaceae bacterium]